MLRCSKEAFAACPDRKGCGCPEEATFTEGSECHKFNLAIDSHVMTNADRIRAMSDEELEEFIRAISLCYEPWCDHHCVMEGDYNCNSCLAKWLKQPVEEVRSGA